MNTLNRVIWVCLSFALAGCAPSSQRPGNTPDGPEAVLPRITITNDPTVVVNPEVVNLCSDIRAGQTLFRIDSQQSSPFNALGCESQNLTRTEGNCMGEELVINTDLLHTSASCSLSSGAFGYRCDRASLDSQWRCSITSSSETTNYECPAEISGYELMRIETIPERCTRVS